jgi:glycine cleavage system aminomethyltransferase T
MQVMDISSKTCMLTLAGPASDEVMQQLSGGSISLAGKPHGSFQMMGFKNGTPVIIAVGSGLGLPGYTLIMDESVGGDIYSTLAEMVGGWWW